MTRKLLLVKWIDSHSTPKWVDPREVDPRPAPCITVGYLIHENKEAITLAQSLQDDGTGHVNACMTIPKSCITSRRSLK